MSDEKDLEQGFNESELHDIMSEIENLEEEFATDTTVDDIEELKIKESKSNDMQADIDNEVDAFLDKKESDKQEEIDITDSLIEDLDAELNGSPDDSEEAAMQDIDNEIEEAFSEVQSTQEVVEENVIPIATSSPSSIKEPHGNGTFNMNFDIGGTPVQLNFDGGLVMSVAGVQIKVFEESGCSVELPGGIKFTVPIDAVDKKKAA